MLNSTSIAQINRALENSFGNIKRDMNDLKVLINSQSDSFSGIRKELESIKADAVTKDKINVLKIKLGEVNEEVKRVLDLEKNLKVSPSTVKSLKQIVDELNAKLIALDVRFNQLNKTAISETQLKTLVTQVNTELNRFALELRNSEVKRDDIRRSDIEQYTKHLSNKIVSSNQDITNLRSDLKNYVDKNEVKRILDDINNDFSNVKKEIGTIYKRDNAFVRETEVKDILKKINKEFDGVANELESLKKQNKDFLTVGQVKGLVTDISNEFDDIRAELSKIGKSESPRKDIDDLRKSFANLEKEVKRVDSKAASKEEVAKEIKNVEKSAEIVSVRSHAPAKKVNVIDQRKKFAFAGFLIFVSFLLLLASIYSYYTGNFGFMDNFAISAVVVFIVGMLIRVYAVIKSSKV